MYIRKTSDNQGCRHLSAFDDVCPKRTHLIIYSMCSCVIMLRTCILCLLLTISCGKAFANIDVELDVVFNDSTFQCRHLYVLCPAADGTKDTLAVFDTLLFNGRNRVSLFYSVHSEGKNMLSMVNSAGVHVESNLLGRRRNALLLSLPSGNSKSKLQAKSFSTCEKTMTNNRIMISCRFPSL